MASRSKVKRDYAELSDGTRYATHSKSGGWVRLSMKRHEQKDMDDCRASSNNSARRRMSKQQ